MTFFVRSKKFDYRVMRPLDDGQLTLFNLEPYVTLTDVPILSGGESYSVSKHADAKEVYEGEMGPTAAKTTVAAAESTPTSSSSSSSAPGGGLLLDQPPPLRAPTPQPAQGGRDLFEVSELRAQLTLAQIGDRVTNQIWHSCTTSW